MEGKIIILSGNNFSDQISASYYFRKQYVIFKIPISVCNKLDGLRRKVFWLCIDNFVSFKSWDECCESKEKWMIGFSEDEGNQ